MTDALMLLASSLAAVAAGCLGLAVTELFLAAPAQRDPGLHDSRVIRILPWLRAVWLPKGLRRRWAGGDLTRQLSMAGLPWAGDDFVSARWLLLWVALILGAAILTGRRGDLVGWFLAGILLTAAWFGPPTWLSLRQERRQREIDRSLPDFLDRLSLALEAGLGFDVALRRSAERYPGRLGEELRRMVRQLDRGHARGAALEEMAGRNPSDDLRAFAAAVRQADRLGTSLARALRVQSGLLRDRRRRRAQEAGRRLPVLIVFPLVFFFLPALLIVYLAPPLLHLFLGR
jgi:tight adherence protein C